MQFKHCLPLIWLLATAAPVFSQMTVYGIDKGPFGNPAELIAQYLTGGGIELLDVKFEGLSEAIGYFTDGDSAIGLKRGLIMTTGAAEGGQNYYGADGAGVDFASNTNSSLALSKELQTILIDGQLRDIAVFRIKFKPAGDSIRFRFVFGSEEYPEFACSKYNDIFGFFLNGPRPDGTGNYADFNMALIPGTNLPVSINNLHPVNPSANGPCPPLNTQFYNDRQGSNKQPVYDGFSDVFIAEAAVTPCGIYEMVLAIADVGDSAYDSGVFLEAKSFSGGIKTATSYPLGKGIIPENAKSDTITLTLKDLPAAALPLRIGLSGTAKYGTDYLPVDTNRVVATKDTVLHFVFQPLPDTLKEGLETLIFDAKSAGCIFQSFTLYIADPPPGAQNIDTLYLDGNKGPVTLDASATVLSGKQWAFSNSEQKNIPQPTQFNINPAWLTSSINVNQIPLANLLDVALLQSVCLNVQHPWVEDLDVYLRTPDGRTLELTSDNGGSGDNFSNTCFSPTAKTPIKDIEIDQAPFTENYQPEGDWQDIDGTPLNGAWTINLKDDSPGNAGVLQSWSITFSGEQFGDFHYSWNTGDTSRILTTMEPGLYKVTVHNAVSNFVRKFVVLPKKCAFSVVDAERCVGDSLKIGNEVFNRSRPVGAVVYPYSAACDSFAVVGVDFVQPVLASVQLSACSGDTLYYRGLRLDEKNPTGEIRPSGLETCDSLISVKTVFQPRPVKNIAKTIQAGESYTFGNQIFTKTGDYKVRIPATAGCDTLVFLRIDVLSGVEHFSTDLTIRIVPNPAQHTVALEWDDAAPIRQAILFRPDGQKVAEYFPGKQEKTVHFNLAGLPAGVYFAMLERFDSKRFFRPLVKM
jgi:subtilisin-like proprotein convertase family protein